MDMRGSYIETTVECRLFAAPEMLARVIHLDSAPPLIHVHDEGSGLEFVYRLIMLFDAKAHYLFERIA